MLGRAAIAGVLGTFLLFGCGSEVGPTYIDLEESPDEFPNVGSVPYEPATNQYTGYGVTTRNSLHLDSDRFRIYYGGEGLIGGWENLSEELEYDVRLALVQLESAYEYFVHDLGFRSPSLSVRSNDGPFYKLNVFVTTNTPFGGHMNYDASAGLGYIEIRQAAWEYPRLILEPSILIHELGHALTYSDYHWVDQEGTECWWEGIAEWATVNYLASSSYQKVKVEHALSPTGRLPDFNTAIANAYLAIAHKDNCYEIWPFLVYLSRNPDQFPGLGPNTVLELLRNHMRNGETPLHVLERLIEPLTVQEVVGRYWARMAYADINYDAAREPYLLSSRDPTYREMAFDNWQSVGKGHFRVKADKRPMYFGANIVPLGATSETISVSIRNLGNGLEESDFTATISIRDEATGHTRYVGLPGGTGSARLAKDEVATLVIVNTPNTLYQYNPFESQSHSKEQVGLDYEVFVEGAQSQQ